MKKSLITGFLMSTLVFGSSAQSSTNFELGKGLNLSLNNGDYSFSIGGSIKPTYSYTRDTSTLITGRHQFSMQQAQFSLLGNAKNEKLTFYILADFVQTWALLEAWAGFNLLENQLFISAGQKLVNTNNKELNKHQNYFQFVNPSLVSLNFANLGREFGLFIEGDFQLGKIVFKPSINITSGDGINSFGSGTTDRFDYGGAKFGGRLEILPLGIFSLDNNFLGVDLARETNPKLSIGGSFSTNQGASEAVGEGHGHFLFYSQIDEDGLFRNAYPNYQKIYADLVFKYSGFNFGFEYVNTFGSEIKGLYTDTEPNMQTPIYQFDIAHYLILGSGYNVQTGYITKSNWSFDIRYSQITPEFDPEVLSMLTNQEEFTFGISKFLKGQAMKIQVNGGFLTFDQLNGNVFEQKSDFSASTALQVIF